MRAVLFDFDFTLADSSRGAVECANHALRGLGLPAAAPLAIHQTVGLSLAESFLRLTGEGDQHRAQEYARLFVARANQVMEELTTVYAGVPEVLAQLRRGGFRLGVVSTKFRYHIENILARAGMDGMLDTIVGGEDVARHKPDPAGIVRALSELEVRACDACYVGDHPVDAEAAARGGVPFVAVTTGTSDRGAFAGHAPLAVLQDLRELPALLGRQGFRPDL
jgi:phosphoglycolate phosphatase